MSSLSDILSAAKNIAVAINNAAQIYLKVQGAQRSATITATTLVSGSQGRVASISVIVAGSTSGMIYDSSSAGSLVNPLALITNTLGVKVINMPYNTGIVVTPGTGMSVIISYSEG